MVRRGDAQIPDFVMPIIGADKVTISLKAGERPLVRTRTTDGVPPFPTVGDMFINRVDGLWWIYASEPSDPTGTMWAWEPMGQTITRSSVIFVGSEPFDPVKPNATNNWGMSDDTVPDPKELEPFGNDVYISTIAGDITLLAGESPVPLALKSGVHQTVYVGSGPFNTLTAMAPEWGMPTGTLPNPADKEPQPGDIYIDTLNGDILVLE